MNTDLVKQLRDVKTKITTLNNEVTSLKSIKSDIEEQLLTEMADNEISLARTPYGTIAINPEDIASVKDWNEFEKYIYENRALYLLQRRTSQDAYRSEIAIKGAVPGVETFTRKVLSLTKSK